MSAIIGAGAAVAILVAAAAVYYARCRVQTTANGIRIREIGFGSTEASTEIVHHSRASVAPDAQTVDAQPVGARQHNWTELDSQREGPQVRTVPYLRICGEVELVLIIVSCFFSAGAPRVCHSASATRRHPERQRSLEGTLQNAQ